MSSQPVTPPTNNTSDSSVSAPHALPRPEAPWWDGLPPHIASLLNLPDIGTLEPGQRSGLDVVVVGGGVAGLSAAGAAAEAGARVLLVEAAPTLGMGATGRNAGILSAGVNMGITETPPGSLAAELWPATFQEMLRVHEVARQPGAVLSARRTGSFSLATSATAARRLEREARARIAAGLRAEIWTPRQMAEVTGGRLATSGVVAAMSLPDEGRLHPLTLLAHLADTTRKHGALLAGRATVSGMEVERGKGWRLTLADGPMVTARALIWAVGPTARPNARLYALSFAADLPEDFPVFWDAAPYVYYDYRPGDGRMTVSGGRYGAPDATTERDATYHARMAEAARRWLPELAEAEPRWAWGVDLDCSADLLPHLRPLTKSAPGLAIEGLGALGVLPGMVLGQRAGNTLAHGGY
ncbi:MAG TPA: FAD-dependent oxidoreductase [Ktedonobacterales bacterium]|nr:FAD-dependent oxidoreductase [Ktedonobacterales bacterium]